MSEGATTTPTVFLDATCLQSVLPPARLVAHLTTQLPTFSSAIVCPLRSHFSIPPSSLLLLMPSWSAAPALPYLGVKIVTSFPHNSSRHNLPAVHAAYSLFHAATGRPLASLDGSCLTHLRTAAVSALAARYLARPHPQTILLVGAGALAPHLLRAHLAVRPSLTRVIVWNRNAEKGRELAERLGREEGGAVVFESAEVLDEVVGLGDVVVCATSSEEVLVKGGLLKAGAHLNLVGSFTPAMRECDDEAMKRGRVFVDCDAAVEEAGELVGAFERGVMSAGDVAGTLVDLIGQRKVGRRDEEEVTVFKSVGSAVFDLLAAQLAYETSTNR